MFSLEEVKPNKDQMIAAYWPIGKEFDCVSCWWIGEARVSMCACLCWERQSRDDILKNGRMMTEMKKGAFDISESRKRVKSCYTWYCIGAVIGFWSKRVSFRAGRRLLWRNALRICASKKKSTYIGIGYAEQAVLFKLPREEHDIPLDYMLNPKGVTRCCGLWICLKNKYGYTVMRILFLGDVMGRSGRDAVAKHLPVLKEKLSPDVVIV